MTPTSEQLAIIEAGLREGHSIMVKAYAGCAKTSTLKMLAARLRAQPALAVAFNKKISIDLAAALPAWFTVKTLNGLGHSAWAKALGRQRLTLVDRKMGKIITELFKEEKYDGPRDDWNTVRELAEDARKAGLVHQDFIARGRGSFRTLPSRGLTSAARRSQISSSLASPERRCGAVPRPRSAARSTSTIRYIAARCSAGFTPAFRSFLATKPRTSARSTTSR